MAIDPTSPQPAASSERPPAPLAGTRSQAMQRIQVGLFGLGTMVLLVGLANIIMTNAQEQQARVVPEAAPTVAASGEAGPVSDPLVDAGVVPNIPAASPTPQAAPPPTDTALEPTSPQP